MPRRPVESLLARPEEVAELVEHLRAAGRFAFDTEFVSEETFEPVLGLVQIATEERLVAVDPLAAGVDLTEVWELVLDPSIDIVMHAAGEDLRIGWLKTGRLPDRVFDSQIAAGLVGYSYPLSLVNLVSQVVDVSLPGSETRTDWRRRPLTDAQIHYALDDVRHLLAIENRLSKSLDRLGRRDWAEQEFRWLIESIQRRVDDDRWRRLPGLGSLNRRSLEVARRLAGWREDEARRTNRPLRQTLKDDLLVGIAKRQPRSKRDLEALRDFNRPALIARSREILEIVTEAAAVNESDLPEPFERFDDGPGIQMVTSLLHATMAHCCAQHKLSPGLVGTTNDLKELVRWSLEGRPDRRRPDLVSGWRAEVCGKALIEVLEGRTALKINNPGAEVPVTLQRLEGA
jgi:ribonuclease D